MDITKIIIYLVTFAAGTAFFLWNINKRKDELGNIRFGLKRTLNKTTLIICVLVLLSWFVIMYMTVTGKMSLSSTENDHILYAIIGIATATVLATVLAQFTCQTGFYNNGLIMSGTVVQYKELGQCTIRKREDKDYYDFAAYDAKGKQRGSLILEEDEKKKVVEVLKRRGITVDESK